jgi:hypothetical protein
VDAAIFQLEVGFIPRPWVCRSEFLLRANSFDELQTAEASAPSASRMPL